jgi:hypothetical protein
MYNADNVGFETTGQPLEIAMKCNNLNLPGFILLAGFCVVLDIGFRTVTVLFFLVGVFI